MRNRQYWYYAVLDQAFSVVLSVLDSNVSLNANFESKSTCVQTLERKNDMTERCSTLVTLLLSALMLTLAPAARAGFVVSTLGVAGPNNYALLTLSGTTDLTINGPCGGGAGTCVGPSTANVTGNVGVLGTNTGVLSPNASSGFNAINGNLYFASSAACNSVSCPEINGSINQINGNGSNIFVNQATAGVDLDAAAAAAISASSTFSGLTNSSPNTTVSSTTSVSGTGTTTINALNTITVVDLTNFNLGNGGLLILNGTAADQFVINLPASDWGGFQGVVEETGGLTADDVVFNVTGSGTLNSSGGSNSAVLNGIILAPSASIGFAPGRFVGELIAGGPSVHLVSGAQVLGTPSAVPEPAFGAFFLTVLLGLYGLLRRAKARS
jgi:hypothetical protein